MTTPIIPSPLRGAATGARNILDALIARAQLEQQEKRIALEARRVDVDERTAAFDRLIKGSAFIQPDSTLAANEFLHEDFQIVFPGSDPATSELVLNRATIQDIILPEFKKQLDTLSPDEKKDVINRGFNKLLLGEGLSTEELAVRGQVSRIQAEGLQALLTDARFVEDTARRVSGLEQKIRLQVPDEEGRMHEIEFDTSDAARISAELWKHWDLLAWSRQQFKLEEQAKLDIAKEFMEVAKGRQLLITRSQANTIIGAVHSENPNEAVAALRSSPGWNQNLDAALRLYLGGFNLATQSPIPEVAKFPGLQLYIALGAELERIGGKALVGETLGPIAKVLADEGVQIGRPLGFFDRVSGKPFDIYGPLPETTKPGEVREPVGGISPVLIDAVRDALQSQEVTEDFVLENYGQAVLDAATGRAPGPSPEGAKPKPEGTRLRPEGARPRPGLDAALRRRLSALEAEMPQLELNVRKSQQAIADAETGSARALASVKWRSDMRLLDARKKQIESLRDRIGSTGTTRF